MRRFVTIVGACASASLLATSLAAGNENSDLHAKDVAAKQCAAEKKADKDAFHAVYGEHAMRNCIRGTTDEAKKELNNASKECKAERESDPDGFAATYGDGDNAFGKCVSAKVREDIREDADEFQNAAQECRSERESDPEGFRETYGSEHSQGRNAFGKCVSSHVKHDGNSGDEEGTG